MKALIIEDFTTKTGKILRIGDVIESEDGGIILRLIEKGRARPLPSGTHGNAPSCPAEGSSETAPYPEGGEAPLPARFRVGDRVRFAHKRALDVLEGVVLEAKWHPAPISRWWYQLQAGERKVWVSESHTAPGGSGPSNNEGGHP